MDENRAETRCTFKRFIQIQRHSETSEEKRRVPNSEVEIVVSPLGPTCLYMFECFWQETILVLVVLDKNYSLSVLLALND